MLRPMSLVFLLSGGLVVSGAFAQEFTPALSGASLPVPAIRTREEVAAMVEGIGTLKAGDRWARPARLKDPFDAGVLADDFRTEGLAVVCAFRFMAGLEWGTTDDPEWNDIAQHAAALLAARNRGLDHKPAFPAGLGMSMAFYERGYAGTSTSNLSQGHDTLGGAIRSFMDDSDAGNIDRLGHRRWILDPRSLTVGLGQAGEYAALKVFGQGGRRTGSMAYVAWPAPGWQALGWFAPSQAWSFSLDPSAFPGGIKTDSGGPSVRLVRLRDNREWKFSSRRSDGYFRLDTQGFGLPWCLIFRPMNLAALNDQDEFRVDIQGVRNGSGDGVAISYRVRFFNPGPVIPVAVESSRPAKLVVHAGFRGKGFSSENAHMNGLQATMGYVGVPLEHFQWYVDGPDGVLPLGIEINGDGVIHPAGEVIVAPEGGIRSFTVHGVQPGLSYTAYARSKGWLTWVEPGMPAGFPDGTPLETISILLRP